MGMSINPEVIDPSYGEQLYYKMASHMDHLRTTVRHHRVPTSLAMIKLSPSDFHSLAKSFGYDKAHAEDLYDHRTSMVREFHARASVIN